MKSNTQQTTRNTQSEEPGALAAFGGLLLIGALVAAVMAAWYDPQSVAHQSVREGTGLLYAGRYIEALPIIERSVPFDNTPQTHLILSYLYLARRDSDRAEIQARIAVSNSTGSLLAGAWAQLGRVLAFSGHNSAALDAWRMAVRVPSVSQGTAEVRSAVWQSAIFEWRGSDFASSVAHLESLLSGEDSYAISARAKLAQYFAPTNRARSLQLLAEAESMLSTAQQGATGAKPGFVSPIPDMRVPGLREGFSPSAARNLITSLKSALSEADSARGKGASDGVIAALWGSAYLAQGETGLAKSYLQEAVRAQPDSSDAHARLGLALLSGGDVDAALGELQLSTKLDADNPLPRHALANIYMSRKEWDAAALQLRTLRSLEPNAIAARIEVAEYYRQRGQYLEAEANLREAAQVQQTFGPRPGDVDASLALARFYTDVRGEGCEKGLPAAQDSVTMHPDDPDSLDAIGWSLVLCQDASPAIKPLERSVEQGPEVPRFRYHLAKAYLLVGRYSDARTQYTSVMNLDPGGPWERLAKSDVASMGGR